MDGDGYADLVGVDADGELFGYNNGSLVNAGRIPFKNETWRIENSNWSGVKHIASADRGTAGRTGPPPAPVR
ncbi:hypothetical protein FHS29_003947 [Saccharothrix tamanrassetensis]|uniref:Uncharacterized protein n=1 Tax=Saccharothrix tamanrassetensis TaxID=1051531 RepID=A0A841CLV6_9PSEU|nr:hypothetical protein [Saccharothrix tamanrassetensis]MBB5957354.1 hypothetical protein [Saccharothrix tamanrassetensis]